MNRTPITFIILTPSLNQLGYLRRCVASVRDQGVESAVIEHWVIDGGSTDGTVEWLRDQGVSHLSEPDAGMYDALNKGLEMVWRKTEVGSRRSEGEGREGREKGEVVFAWLNADEQYLPGALQRALEGVRAWPSVDIVCGGALIVDETGKLLTYCKSLPLRPLYLRTHLYNLSCGLVFRARVLHGGIRFDPSLQAIADWLFIRKLLAAGARSACLPGYLAAYTFAPGNISNQPVAQAERRALLRSVNPAAALLTGYARGLREVERWWRGTRREHFPLVYEIYTGERTERMEFRASRVPARWPGKKRRMEEKDEG